MFVNVSVVLPDRASVVFVPATAVMRAPYGNSVYIVEDRKSDQGATINGPDGKPAEMTGQSLEVVRRQAGGHWCFVIDEPFGAGA